MVFDYQPRIVDEILRYKLDTTGAVLIEGPKWCGKSRTAKEVSKSKLVISGNVAVNRIRGLINLESNVFLDGEPPMLIDEWQNVPEIWDTIRVELDERDCPGQFILTGSSAPVKGNIIHSGAGRFATLYMRTMSLFESRESTGTISLKGLFDGNMVDSIAVLSIDGIARAIIRGGWPSAVCHERSGKVSNLAEDYLNLIIRNDVSNYLRQSLVYDSEDERFDGTDDTVSEIMQRTLSSIARNVATSASISSIERDVNSRGRIISSPTLAKYIGALKRLFIIENLEAWSPHIRSSTRLSQVPKWHFTDPSLGAAALGISESDLLKDLNTFGFFFESLCLRDLRIYAESLKGQVRYIRNNNGYEVDFIITLRDGRWAGVEVKLGDDEFDKAARNLLKLNEFVDVEKMGKPSFLAILTGTKYGYRRSDGVFVVPIGCLRNRQLSRSSGPGPQPVLPVCAFLRPPF